MVYFLCKKTFTFLRPFSLRYIPRDFRRPNDLAGGVLEWRDCHGNLNQASVFAPSYGVEGLDALSTPDAFKDVGFFVLPIRRNEEGDRFADNLICCITKDSLSPAVPAGDDAINIFGHNRIVRVFYDGSESGFRCFRLFKRCNVVKTQESHACRVSRQNKWAGMQRHDSASKIRPVAINLENLKGELVGKHRL